MTKTRLRWAALPIAAALLLGACSDDEDGDDDDGATTTAAAPSESTTAPDDSTAPEDTALESETTVAIAESDLGEILVDGEGMTLYVFADDSEGVSACVDACVDGWPPLLADDAVAADGVTGELTFIERPDGDTQVAIDGHPLYYFAGDGAAGDTAGQGLAGGAWTVAGPDGAPIAG